jgi:chromosome segregation ATPase
MENTLITIQEGFLREKSLASEQVKERILELNQYIKLLDSVTTKIAEVSVSHRKDVANILNEKSEHESSLNALKLAHSNELKTYSEKVEAKLSHSNNLDKDIIAKESKIVELDKRVEVLLGEMKSSQESLDIIRVQSSHLQRSAGTTQSQEDTLKKSVEKLTKEEAEISSSIEAKKKELGRLSSDLAILEARK